VDVAITIFCLNVGEEEGPVWWSDFWGSEKALKDKPKTHREHKQNDHTNTRIDGNRIDTEAKKYIKTEPSALQLRKQNTANCKEKNANIDTDT
jgi:hypothetical protein